MLEDGQRNELHMRKAMIAIEVLDSEALDFLWENHELSPKYHMAVFTQIPDLYR